jgi:hypothetical protein
MYAVENIPSEDKLCRHVYSPRMKSDERGLIWDFIFEFPEGAAESVAWEKYASLPTEMHRIGIARAEIKRKSNPDFAYSGYLPAIAGDITAIKTTAGHGFSVRHVPWEGRHHVHLAYSPSEEAQNRKLTKSEKGDLKQTLRNKFGPLVVPTRADLPPLDHPPSQA